MLLLSIWESTTPICMYYNNVSVHYLFLLSYTIFKLLKLTTIDFILDLIIIPTVNFFEIVTLQKKSASEILTLLKKVLLKFS